VIWKRYEGLTAFFLEAGFLGVLLFGRKLVPPWAHFGAAILVAVGTFSSSFWILAVNSWMQCLNPLACCHMQRTGEKFGPGYSSLSR
jgi:cytochrome bd-type quinol oxidase subunit 1